MSSYVRVPSRDICSVVIHVWQPIIWQIIDPSGHFGENHTLITKNFRKGWHMGEFQDLSHINKKLNKPLWNGKSSESIAILTTQANAHISQLRLQFRVTVLSDSCHAMTSGAQKASGVYTEGPTVSIPS